MRNETYLAIFIISLAIITGATYISDTYMDVDRLNVSGNADIYDNLMVEDNFTGDFFYGEMWNYSANATAWTFSIAAAGVYYNFTGLAQGELNGFTFTGEEQGNGGSYLTANVAGLYRLGLGMSFATTGSSLIGVSMSKNFDQTSSRECYAREQVATPNAVEEVALSCLVRLAVGDSVNVKVENEFNPPKDLKIHAVNLNLVRVGD